MRSSMSFSTQPGWPNFTAWHFKATRCLSETIRMSPVSGSATELKWFLMQLRVRGGDESFEQRVRLVRFALKFRMKLRCNKKWMVR